MTVAWKLLIAGGGGAFTPPAPVLEAFDLTTGAAGGGIWFNNNQAIQSGGVLVFGYVRGDNGDACVRTYIEATETTNAERVLHAALDVDDHSPPSLGIRSSDGKLLTFYAEHDGPTGYKRVSTTSVASDPDLSDGFAAEVDLDAALLGTDYTYMGMFELSDGIYLFMRDIVSSPTQQLVMWKSTDNGATWGARTLVFEQSGRSSYWRMVKSGADRIDFIITDGHPAVDSGPSTYHVALDSGSWVKSNGSSAGSLPLDTSDLTLIASGATTMTWVYDVAVDTDGNVYAGWIRYATPVSDLRYMWGKLDIVAGTWAVEEIAAAGASISGTVGSNYYAGGMAFDQDTPWVVYLSMDTGTELWRFETADEGATWDSELLLDGAGDKIIMPQGVVNPDRVRCIAKAGTFSSFTSYSLRTVGVREVA